MILLLARFCQENPQKRQGIQEHSNNASTSSRTKSGAAINALLTGALYSLLRQPAESGNPGIDG
jgi:hypothetical protein